MVYFLAPEFVRQVIKLEWPKGSNRTFSVGKWRRVNKLSVGYLVYRGITIMSLFCGIPQGIVTQISIIMMLHHMITE